MKTIEYIIIALLILGFYFGFVKGFLRQLASLISFVIAFFVSSAFAGQLQDFLIAKNYLSESSSIWISYIACFVGAIIIIKIITKIIEKILKKLGLNLFNKFAGGVVNILKWGLGISFILYFAKKLNLLSIDENSSILYFLHQIGGGFLDYFFGK